MMREWKALSKSVVLLVILFFCSAKNAIAEDEVASSKTKFKLEVAMLSANKLSEQGGDEIYISVVEYSNFGKSTYHRVPSYPTYWLSKHLPSVKKVRLWERDFQDGDAAQLIVSVVERDIPPWNVDDLIGSIKINVNQNDGHLSVEWDPNQYKNEAEVDQLDKDKPVFVLRGDNSNYKISFDVISETVKENTKQ